MLRFHSHQQIKIEYRDFLPLEETSNAVKRKLNGLRRQCSPDTLIQAAAWRLGKKFFIRLEYTDKKANLRSVGYETSLEVAVESAIKQILSKL